MYISLPMYLKIWVLIYTIGSAKQALCSNNTHDAIARNKRQASSGPKITDRCGSENAGVCVLVNDCPSAVNEIQLTRKHNIEHCGWDNMREVICCMDPVVKPTAVKKSVEACIKYGENTTFGATQRVVDGLNATLGEFPHMAALGFNSSEDFGVTEWGACGGSLISENYVLTAAHCLFRVDRKKPIAVRLGKVDLFGNEDGVPPQDIPVADTILHPGYNHFKKINDIALIKLSRPAQYSSNVYPSCLYTEPDTPNRLLVSGWGVSNRNNGVDRFLLQYAMSPLDLSKCNETFAKSPSAKSIEASQLCATLTSPKDLCHVLSGSPIQAENVKQQYGPKFKIVGLASFGRGCKTTSNPSVYTRVYSYLDWIENTVWP